MARLTPAMDFFMKYCWKRAVFKRMFSYGRTPFVGHFLYISLLNQRMSSMRSTLHRNSAEPRIKR